LERDRPTTTPSFVRPVSSSCGSISRQLTDDGLVAAQRLYVEQVERDGPAIEEAERQLGEPAR
jgi:hypothetical protein